MWLTGEIFLPSLAATPLIAIDLVARDCPGEVLLGERLNRPAHGYRFVPGGRGLKNESLDDALRRVTLAELNRVFER